MARNWTDAERARHSKAMKAIWAKKHRDTATQRAPKKAPRVVVTQNPKPQPVGFITWLKGVLQNLSGSRA